MVKIMNLVMGMCFAVLITAIVNTNAFAQEQPKVEPVKITDELYVIDHVGGTVVVWVGKDGLYMIDGGVPEASQLVIDTVKKISDKPLRILVNTHSHYDHAGGNKALYGEGAVIMSTENSRKRMLSGGKLEVMNLEVPPVTDTMALPVVAFDSKIHLFLDGEAAEVIPVHNAHTDGDAIIYWPEKNIIHAGDLFFNRTYPLIDVGSGGDGKGYIKAVEMLISMSNDKTKIIAGHGPVGNLEDLKVFHSLLKDVQAKVEKAKKDKMSLEDWKKTDPLKEYNEKWGNGFFKPDIFMAIAWSAF